MSNLNEQDARRILEKRAQFFQEQMRRMPSHEKTAEYTNRFVAFIDILGFRSIVRETEGASPNELFHSVVDSYWFASATATVSLRILSDSILMVSKDEQAASFIEIANTVNAVRNSFLERGILLRGGISYGNHFESDEICISPALIDAYELENTRAAYPRIICSSAVLDFVLPAVSRTRSGRDAIIGPFGNHVLRDQLPVPDFDRVPIIEFLPDTLEAYFLRTGHHHDPSVRPTSEQLQHFKSAGLEQLTRLRAGIELARQRCSIPVHRQKVDYLIEKWNSYILTFVELSNFDKNSQLL
jgi:hypothetical protein